MKEMIWGSGSRELREILVCFKLQKQEGIFPLAFRVIAIVIGFRLSTMWNLSFIQSAQTANALSGVLYSIHFPIKSAVSNQTPIVNRESEIDTIITLIQSCQSSYGFPSFSSLRIYQFQWIMSYLFKISESNHWNDRIF